MREVNFSIPSVNKASVGITTALYDRRALDCTSTLPLINSLNHLAYLTTSSARIRDILTVDGGVERLVCILKQGRSKDMMILWKWNLAFQCVVNIGVRGTEAVRTRVVEADMVPVIATMLDNYVKVQEKKREKSDEAKQKQLHDHHHRHRTHDHRSLSKPSSSSSTRTSASGASDQRSARRQGPPPYIDLPTTYGGSSATAISHGVDASSSARPASSSTDRTTASASGRQRLDSRNVDPARQNVSSGALRGTQALAGQLSTLEPVEGFLRPVRDVERLVSMSHVDPTEMGSQPTSPTTPLPLPQLRSPALRSATDASPTSRSRRRPSIRHQNSTADADDLNTDSMPSDEAPDAEMTETTEIQAAVGIQDISMDGEEAMLAETSLDLATPTASENHQETETFNITHRTSIEGVIDADNDATPVPAGGMSPDRAAMISPQPPTIGSTTLPPNASTTVPRYLLERSSAPSPQGQPATVPRDEDVLMSLQLLAYVSKYCGLRSYFQQSHLVPKLKIGKELLSLDGDETVSEDEDDANSDTEADEEYLLPNDFNLFPLVEKYTTRHYSTDMQYWAGVVMRNLCRKDDTRGGIRQCAYYQCGRWEEFTRQFAKCRRCRRTKYCSKECQKSAWAFHRHWCIAASS